MLKFIEQRRCKHFWDIRYWYIERHPNDVDFQIVCGMVCPKCGKKCEELVKIGSPYHEYLNKNFRHKMLISKDYV